ncbi:MAG: hypothetical protein ACFFBP_22090 [Promethearchaeota archaeon]
MKNKYVIIDHLIECSRISQFFTKVGLNILIANEILTRVKEICILTYGVHIIINEVIIVQ